MNIDYKLVDMLLMHGIDDVTFDYLVQHAHDETVINLLFNADYVEGVYYHADK